MGWRWKSSRGSYQPGDKGYVEVWIKNYASSVYVSEVGTWFDCMHNEHWFKRCDRSMTLV